MSTVSPDTSNGSSKQTIICVFCGASPGKSPVYIEAARSLAKALHQNNIKLVYGGGNVGLMGELARTLVALSGPTAVHGIIPKALLEYERGVDSSVENGTANKGKVPEEEIYGVTTVVDDMHTRKNMMVKEVLSGGPGSGFIALPGGYGTLEELMEVVTWNQLGIHNRGVVVYNVDGYWDGLMQFVQNSVEKGFVGENNRGIIVAQDNAEGCVTALKEYIPEKGRFKLEWGNE